MTGTIRARWRTISGTGTCKARRGTPRWRQIGSRGLAGLTLGGSGACPSSSAVTKVLAVPSAAGRLRYYVLPPPRSPKPFGGIAPAGPLSPTARAQSGHTTSTHLSGALQLWCSFHEHSIHSFNPPTRLQCGRRVFSWSR